MTAVALPLRFCRKQAAEYLGISLATLARLMKAKLIEFVRPSPKKVYFLERHLLAYQERNTQPCVESKRGGSGNLDAKDKWIFCLKAA